LLTLEHRSAPAPDPLALVLATGVDGTTPHLRRASTGETPPPAEPLADRLLRLLRAATAPVSRVALRRQLGVKNLHLGQALTALEDEHVICRTAVGWRVSSASPAQLNLST
jgi:DNA-binding GntR family transcriptional regulator